MYGLLLQARTGQSHESKSVLWCIHTGTGKQNGCIIVGVNGVFTLTETGSETETHKIATVPNDISVSSQSVLTPHNSFQANFIGLQIGLGFC